VKNIISFTLINLFLHAVKHNPFIDNNKKNENYKQCNNYVELFDGVLHKCNTTMIITHTEFSCNVKKGILTHILIIGIFVFSISISIHI